MSPANQSASGVKDELAALLEDIIELASSATGVDRGKLDELKQGLHERVEKVGADAQAAAKEAASTVQARASEAFDQVDNYAHAKPWHLIAAAGVIGLLVGVLVARK